MKFSFPLLVLCSSNLALPATITNAGVEDAIEDAVVSFIKEVAAPSNAAAALHIQKVAHVERSVAYAALESLQTRVATTVIRTAGSIFSFLGRVVTRPQRLILPAEDPAVMAEIKEFQAKAAELAQQIHAQLDPMVTAAKAVSLTSKPSSEKMASQIRLAPKTAEDLEKALAVVKSPHSNPNIATSLAQTKPSLTKRLQV